MHFVFEKFTTVYLFQIGQEKSCDFLKMIHLETHCLRSLSTHCFLIGRLHCVCYSKYFKACNIWKSPTSFSWSSTIFENFQECLDDCCSCLEMFGWYLLIFGKVWVILGSAWKNVLLPLGIFRSFWVNFNHLWNTYDYHWQSSCFFVLTLHILVVICSGVALKLHSL